MSINISYLILGMYQAPLETAFRSKFKGESLAFFMASQFQALQMGGCETDLSNVTEFFFWGMNSLSLTRDIL